MSRYYHHIAQHYSQVQEYKVCIPNLHSKPLFLRLYVLTERLCSGFQLAEKCFVKGGDPRAAIEMYTKANMYEAAHKVTFLDS